MKKICFILFLITLTFIGMKSFAAVITERKINKPAANSQSTVNTKTKTFSNNIKTCKPYTETMKSDYMGMNMNYKISIAGWVNNKCRLDFTAETNGVSSSFESLYGVNLSDVSVSAFAPKIRCEFTRQQLEYVGDSILQENERNAGATNNMLKDPNSVNLSGFTNLSGSDAKLLEVVLGSHACTITNGAELNNMLQNLMGY